MWKEDEQVIFGLLEVEVDFKEEEEDEHVVLGVLEVEGELEEEEEEEQVIWRSRWSSRRKRRKNRSF